MLRFIVKTGYSKTYILLKRGHICFTIQLRCRSHRSLASEEARGGYGETTPASLGRLWIFADWLVDAFNLTFKLDFYFLRFNKNDRHQFLRCLAQQVFEQVCIARRGEAGPFN